MIVGHDVIFRGAGGRKSDRQEDRGRVYGRDVTSSGEPLPKEDVLALGDPDMYSAGNPVQATTTTLKELQVFPQPVQKPHPQPWEPLTSARSLKFAAEHGINGVMIAEPNDRLRRNIEI